MPHAFFRLQSVSERVAERQKFFLHEMEDSKSVLEHIRISGVVMKVLKTNAKRLLLYAIWLSFAFLARALVFLLLAVGYAVGESSGCVGICDACQSTAYLVTMTLEQQV
jgi:hypothetical protein